MAINSDYNEVAARIVEARKKHPEGILQPLDPATPYKIETIGDKTFIVYVAAFYRTPEDTKPGIGTAWEPFPGLTNFTRNSELMNAETSAWGRALVAAFAADAKKGIATSLEVRNREAERQAQYGPPDQQGWPEVKDPGEQLVTKALLSRLAAQFATLGVAGRDEGLMTIGALIGVQVTSTKALTNAQASQLIGALDPLTKAEDPPAALAAALREAMAEKPEESHDDAA
ncbi:hypothetical protein OG884_18335 [Streptosporangium sp. NBC_01755]|uniref:hypothetical protein n=1 Tax=Streptosporangium sp. NBC_01755 TaxID=2975949 RepID=UPI002DDA922F|nr:hypothetical protein [Streptosporangium sp. NBC_01755]WSD03765.1 hypothetical protein OG884_18335 [Streptosporangium sp. NBC_01755]